jgi:hypothetical protein
VPSQYVLKKNDQPVLYIAPPVLAPWATATLGLAAGGPPPPTALRASATSLEGPFYRLTVDPRTGGLARLVHKPTGRELVVAGPRTVGQTVYFDGREAPVTDFQSDVETVGPVLARLHVTYSTGPARTDVFVTLYAAVDRVDFDYRVVKKPSTLEERLVHVFLVVFLGATLRLDTTGVVIRLCFAPEGDFVKGANTRRFSIQYFVDVSSAGGGVTVAPSTHSYSGRLDPLSSKPWQRPTSKKSRKTRQGAEFRFR